MFDFLRLRKNVPAEVPPEGFVDIIYDANYGKVAVRFPDNFVSRIVTYNTDEIVEAPEFLAVSGTGNSTSYGFSSVSNQKEGVGYSYQWPNVSGFVAVAPDTTYANDVAAAAGGVAVGEIYFTGTKFRTRMS